MRERKREMGRERVGEMERGAVQMVLWLAFAMGASLISGEQFKVGDRQGWHEPDAAHADMYALWAGKTDFHAGDSLYFQYTNDSVWVVDKRGYYHCNTNNSTASFQDGATVFLLRAPGLLYFISGNSSHCTAGQRLIVDVAPSLLPLQPPLQPPTLPPLAGPTAPPQSATLPPLVAPTAPAQPPTIPPLAATPPPLVAAPTPARVTTPQQSPTIPSLGMAPVPAGPTLPPKTSSADFSTKVNALILFSAFILF